MADTHVLVFEKPTWINPVDGIITSLGGLRENPVTQKSEFHDGVDIACVVGTPVLAVRDGKVLATGLSPSYGYYVKLEYDNGYTSLYAHLSSVSVNENDAVTQGQTVALSGNTGRSTGPHLHYSLFNNNQYVDPLQYLDFSHSQGTELALRGVNAP